MSFPSNDFNNNLNYPNFALEKDGQMNQQQPNQQTNENNNSSLANLQTVVRKFNNTSNNKILDFLNTKNTSILTFAASVAVGLCIKDFISALVLNLFQPSLMLLILTLDKNNYLPFTESIREKNPKIDIAKVLGASLILKIVLFIVYLIYNYSSLLF